MYALARDERRAAEAVGSITAAVPGADVRPEACDVSCLAALREFAEEFGAREPRLDVLVNNAGVMPDQRMRSAERHELMFATHVLAPLALSTLLAGLLARSAPATVINVSSGGMYSQGLPGEDWESDRSSYRPKVPYAPTKREEVVITELLASRLRERGVVVHAYLGQAPNIRSGKILLAVASIVTVEARHSGAMGLCLGKRTSRAVRSTWG